MLKAVRPVIASNGGPYFQMTVRSHSTLESERTKNEQKDGKGSRREIFFFLFFIYINYRDVRGRRISMLNNYEH